MNKLKLAIIVGEFPILSQSFIIRMIESLFEEGLNIDIYATDSSNLLKLQNLSPNIYQLLVEDKIKLYTPYFSNGKKNETARKVIHLAINFLKQPVFAASLLTKGIRFRTLRHSLAIRQLLKKNDYDVIHTQFLNLAVAFAAGMLDKNNRAKLISYVRGFDVSREDTISKAEYAFLFSNNRLTSITSVCQSLADIAAQRGFPANHVKVIHAGIPLHKFSFSTPTNRKNNQLRFIQVGRLIDKKGFELSLKMLSKIGIENFFFDIVGDGPNSSSLKNLTSDLGISDKVHFHGALSHSDTAQIIARSDIMLAPSLTDKNGDAEGIPNVLKEAMALGIICIASDHSGITELITDSKSGYIFKESDIIDFMASTQKAINNRETWEYIAHNARQVIENLFNDRLTAKELIKHYELYSNFSMKN